MTTADTGPTGSVPPTGDGSASSNDVSFMKGKLAVLEETIKSIHEGESGFFKKIIWFTSLFTVVAGILGTVSYTINQSKLDDAIKRVDDALGRTTPTSLHVNTIYGQTIIGRYELRYESGHGGKDYYDIYVEFDVRVNVEGHGIAKIIGINASYAGDIISLLSIGKNGVDSEFSARMQAGMFDKIDPIYVGQTPVEVEFWVRGPRITCDGGQNVINRMHGLNNVGRVTVTVLTDNAVTEVKPTPFDLVIKEAVGNLTCKEYNP